MKNKKALFAVGVCLILLLFSGSLVWADTILTVQSIKDLSGSHSTDQSLRVLDDKDLSGKTDDWDRYIEFDPGNNSHYSGIFVFQLPSSITPAMVRKLSIETNYMGSSKEHQKWIWEIKDVRKNRYIRLGDNSPAQEWAWASMKWLKTGNSCIKANGQIIIRLRSNNKLDICNLDQLIIRVSTSDDPFKNIPLKSTITQVQPMSGIVLWTDSDSNRTDAIQLEYAYVGYDSVVQKKDQYNWQAVEALLDAVAARGHQAILRFHYVYPGRQTTVPDHIKSSTGYNETKGQTEGQTTWFPDWSFPQLQAFTLDFYTRLAERYDNDPRIAFLQTGFGLWAEYHIYDGPFVLGKTFPSKAFQSQFVRHLDAVFQTLRWNISIDAADSEISPFAGSPDLAAARFGLFDDSFLHQTHDVYNAECFNFFNYPERFQYAPMGGELSYYSDYDQQHALDPKGPYGISFEQLAAQYGITYMIGNDQPEYQSDSRIKAAGMATGYRFTVTAFKASASQSVVSVTNTGIAPIYYDAYVAVNGVRATESLKGLLPGNSHTYEVGSGGESPALTIESDRLVAGQQITYEANTEDLALDPQ